ncbi:TraB/GumN family protein [Luteimonas sp. R10]|uniref:TraB/GumN family protein n=1 Tax=Luteimonas sp. R10 TaxID=3108176 RepID=UPI003086D357|nr:TraB/GumN family protein [Luteimonas sp. R10]
MDPKWLLLAALFLGGPTSAQEAGDAEVVEPAAGAAGTDDGIVEFDTVVVSGLQPGPGLWKVSKGDNTLHILGTLSPLPRRMEWVSAEVEAVIAGSQEVIGPPSISMRSGLGMFRSMLLLPSLLKVRRNPDGRTLEQSVPPELYARWKPLKARYIGGDRGIERWRPIFAAQELYEAAMRESGLTQDGVVQKTVARAAKRSKVRITPVDLELVVEDPKAAIREFRAGPLADTDCFAKTLTRIETDLDAMRQRANAWAVGDIEALRALPYDNQYSACIRAITKTGLARRLGIDDAHRRAADAWVAAAEQTLANNASSFATLPMSLLLSPDGYLATLQAKGYAIQAP